MTIVFTHASNFMKSDRWNGRVYFVDACKTGNAFWQHCDMDRSEFCPNGTRIKWSLVTDELKQRILAEYADLWDIKWIGGKNGYPVDWEAKKDAGTDNCAHNEHSK